MAKFGLPTYPIAAGMLIGNREPDELEWLLDNGNIQSGTYQYVAIVKTSDTEYRLVSVDQAVAIGKEETLLTTTTLASLLNGITEPIDISGWRWWGKHE